MLKYHANKRPCNARTPLAYDKIRAYHCSQLIVFCCVTNRFSYILVLYVGRGVRLFQTLKALWRLNFELLERGDDGTLTCCCGCLRKYFPSCKKPLLNRVHSQVKQRILKLMLPSFQKISLHCISGTQSPFCFR